MKTLIQRAREGARRAAAKAAQTAKRALPRAKALWDRFGYALSMLALLALIGGAASLYRSRAQQSAQSAPTPTPEPALVSSVALNAQMEAQEEPSFLMPVQGEIVGAFAPDELTWSDTLKLWQTHDGIDRCV